MTKTELREKIDQEFGNSMQCLRDEISDVCWPLLEQVKRETARDCARNAGNCPKGSTWEVTEAAILACGESDKPVGPFGCECWVDHPDGGWRHMDNGIVNLCGSRWTHCPFCGKARVQA